MREETLRDVCTDESTAMFQRLVEVRAGEGGRKTRYRDHKCFVRRSDKHIQMLISARAWAPTHFVKNRPSG